ncbi:MAG: hypothetical protein Q4B42_03325 [Oscillospiraceae bacterium]|nr:hypothetical protein [Oscillospiraceae bacterium]
MRLALIIQAALLLALAIFSALSPKRSITLSAAEMQALSGYTNEDGARVMDDSFGYLERFVKTPRLSLPRGSYTVSIFCERNIAGNMLTIDLADESEKGVWKDDFSLMSAGVGEVQTTVWVWGSEASVSAAIYYQAGRVIVSGAEVRSNGAMAVFAVFCLALLFAVGDILVWQFTKGGLSSKYRERRLVFLALAAAVLLSSAPLFFEKLYAGHDLESFLMRFEGIKEGFLAGQFPVRMNPFALFGYGYADSLMYPSLFLWPFALLRMCSLPVMFVYKLLIFCANAATCFVAYISFKAIVKRPFAAALGAAAYTLALYRAVNIYLRAAVGEALAMIFLPLVLAALYAMLFEPAGTKEFKKGFWMGIAGYSGIIQSHLISCLLIGLTTLCVCLVCIKRVFERARFAALAKTAGFTLALNAWSLAPIIEGMGLELLMYEYSYSIAAHAATLGQLFTPLGLCKGEAMYLEQGTEGEIPLGFGLALMAAALCMVFVFLKRGALGETRGRMGLAALAFAAAALFACSVYFPWDWLYSLLPSIVTTIQFPWRLLSLVSVWLALAAAVGACYIDKNSIRVLCVCLLGAACVVQTLYFIQDYDDSAEFYEMYSISPRSIVAGEYLPQGAGLHDCNKYYPEEDAVEVLSFSRDKLRIDAQVSNTSQNTEELELTLLYYPGYKAADENGNELELTGSEGGMLSVSIPALYEGGIEVSFVGRPLWRVSEAISLITLALLILYWRRRKSRAPASKETEAEEPHDTAEFKKTEEMTNA